MAQEQDEIIIIEDVDAINDAPKDEDSPKEEAGDSKKKLLIFGAIGVLLLLIIVVLLLFVTLKEEKTHTTTEDDTLLDEKLSSVSKPKISPSKLEKLIAKANYLYTNGNKQKALTLYEKIAQYSEAISVYNLGVAQLKEKQYALALQTFQRAIENDEKRCVSAINAAVCALHLNQKDDFRYYLDLAYAYLPYEQSSPLYSYYYTLIAYYNKEYFSSLNSLKNATTKAYPKIQNHLKAKIYAMYNSNYNAIDALEQNYDDTDDLSLGLLYARVGDPSLSVKHFKDAILKGNNIPKAQLAMGYVYLKSGQISLATSAIKQASTKYPDETASLYPLKIKLQKALFDPKAAQHRYRNEILKSQETIYAKIFYFSPYKMFNADQTISYIRKGNANTFIDNVESAKEYFEKGTTNSSVNKGMTIAIKQALNLHIREANEIFQKLLKIQPKHSILQYNLALTYAQLGNMNKAHKHFLKSYYLDSKNYLAGIYAIYTAQLTNQKYKKLRSILKDSLSMEDESKEKELYTTLINIADKNYIDNVDWIQSDTKKGPLNLALKTIIATQIQSDDIAKEASAELSALLPEDILPHIIYIDTHFKEYNDVEYPKEVIKYFKKQHFSYNDLYYGPFITRYLYIQMNLIIGKLYYVVEQLKQKIESAPRYSLELESTLALATLFNKEFEFSYTLYNHLIDDLKIHDAYTLYLGAVASTAAGHHENAIALLELSKMKNKDFYESRYALALLYLERGNYEAALIQLSRIHRENFQSNYFDFDIDTQKLLFQKQHQEK